jgi:hypothetical protein
LVSIKPDPGAIESAGFAVRAVTGPAPQPARIAAPDPSIRINPRRNDFPTPDLDSLGPASASLDEICMCKFKEFESMGSRVCAIPKGLDLQVSSFSTARSNTPVLA